MYPFPFSFLKGNGYHELMHVNTLFFELYFCYLFFATTNNTYAILQVFKPFEDGFISYASFCNLLISSTLFVLHLPVLIHVDLSYSF